MSLYKGFAQQKGLNSYLVDIPDPGEKIRQQGLEVMRGMEDQIQHNSEQSQRAVAAFDENHNSFQKQLERNANDKAYYAGVLAKAKWRNYEIAIKNAEIQAKKEKEDFDALLSLTKSGAELAKMGIDHNRKMTDQFVDQLYRDYGMTRDAFNAIKSADDKVLSDNTSLQGLLRKWEVSGDIPMDVIAKIRRSGGYMSLAVSKNEARIWGRQLKGRIGARSNEKIQLPGMEMPISLNDALATGGPTIDAVVDELVKQELYLDGNPRFSNKVLALAGVAGPDGYIARTKGHFTKTGNEILVENEWNDRHKETIEIIKDFMGPANQSSVARGPAGINAAIIYLAGGEDASREQLSAARTRVVGAIVDGLRNQSLTWEEVRELGNYKVKTRGAPGGVPWKKLFGDDWNQIQEAGRAFVAAEQADFQLEADNLLLEGKGFLTDMKTLVATEEPSSDTLMSFYLYATSPERAHTHAEAAKFLAKEMAANKTRANDARGGTVLLARANNNETITQEEIDQWNFSPGAKATVMAEVAKRNQNLPQPGDNGTQERLGFVIETHLTDLIKRKNTWYTNATHKDTKLYAERKAAGHYRLAREMKGLSHEEAYNYALQEISLDIGSPQKPPRDPYFEVVTNGGKKSFKGALPKPMERIELDPVEIGRELHRNPGLIYTKNYFDASEISAQANKGIYRPIHPTALAIQSLTKGKINAVDVMQAQLQRQRDEETKEFGAPRTQLLPDDYIKRYKNESGKISALGQRLLEDYNIVGVNKAYVKSGYSPPYPTSYYNKADKIIETGDINNITTPDGKMSKSLQVLKFNVSDRTIGEVLRLMQNGTITTAGNAQFDLESLTETLAQSGLTADSKFNFTNQKTLQKTRFKKYGLAGFPHIQPDEYDIQIGENLHQAVNIEKITPSYFREMSSCNEAACMFMRNHPHLFPHLGGTKQ